MTLKSKIASLLIKSTDYLRSKSGKYFLAAVVDLILILMIFQGGIKPAQRIISPLVSPIMPLQSLTTSKSSQEVFGFAPFWTFNKLANVDFNTLTTFAYFGVEVLATGDLDKDSPGYETFRSKQATDIFKKAHASGTRVVLTITQMKNDPILALMDDSEAQERATSQTVEEVKRRGIDGINVDFEYSGDPGQDYRSKYSQFVRKLAERMHQEVPQSRVTVSVYASAVKEPKIYDIQQLALASDGIFMMAYDFAVAGSDNAIPTAPLNGHKEGKYWYDIATAVDDFITLMPSDKLILGVPWYGYNYLIYDEPEVKAETRPSYSWRGQPRAQTYAAVKENITPNMDGIDDFRTGWDELGKVSWLAYRVVATDTWRMLFIDDPKSLSLKYDFAKDKSLKGVGVWALGFDDGSDELWRLLREKFGSKLADSSLLERRISEDY